MTHFPPEQRRLLRQTTAYWQRKRLISGTHRRFIALPWTAWWDCRSSRQQRVSSRRLHIPTVHATLLHKSSISPLICFCKRFLNEFSLP